MRFIIFISALMIAAAINLDYMNDCRIPCYLVGAMALGWDVFDAIRRK